MIFCNPYWEMRTKIELLEKWILVHSYLYYEENVNIIADEMFDSNCKQLRGYCRANEQAFRESKWYNTFKDWASQDANSGFTLYLRLSIEEKAIIRKEAMRCCSIVENRKK